GRRMAALSRSPQYAPAQASCPRVAAQSCLLLAVVTSAMSCRHAGHEQPKLLSWHGRRAEGGYPTLVHDSDPICQGIDLFEFRGDDANGDAIVGLLDQAEVSVFDGSHIEPARQLGSRERALLLNNCTV